MQKQGVLIVMEMDMVIKKFISKRYFERDIFVKALNCYFYKTKYGGGEFI